MKRKLSVSLLALRDFTELEKFLSILKKNNIRYIELPITKLLPNYHIRKKKINVFLRKLKNYNIKISSVQAIYYNKNLNVLKKNHLKKNLLHIKKIIKLTKILKAENIIFGSPLNRKRVKLNNTQSNKNFQLLLSKINNLLVVNNVNFLIEPNSRYYGCNYLFNSKQTLKFVKNSKLSNVFINIDTGNANLEKDKINFKSKDQLYVKNIQISEKDLKGLSDNISKHKVILKKLDLNNKFISLEMLDLDINKLEKNIKKFKFVSKISN